MVRALMTVALTALSVLSTQAIAGRVLLQDSVVVKIPPVGNDSLPVPILTFQLGTVPAVAPAQEPSLEGELLLFTLAPARPPAASSSQELPATSGRKMLQVDAPSPAPSLRFEVLAPLSALAAQQSPLASAACTPIQDVLNNPTLTQFASLATTANLTGQLANLGNNYTLLIPNDDAIAAALVADSAAVTNLVQSSAARSQVIAQNLIPGTFTGANVVDGEILLTNLANAPLTVAKTENSLSFKSVNGSIAKEVSAAVSCTVNVFIVDTLLIPTAAVSG